MAGAKGLAQTTASLDVVVFHGLNRRAGGDLDQKRPLPLEQLDDLVDVGRRCGNASPTRRPAVPAIPECEPLWVLEVATGHLG